MGLTLYHFRPTAISVKKCKFSYPSFNTQFRLLPFEFSNDVSELEWGHCQMMDSCIICTIISTQNNQWTDRQTDRQTATKTCLYSPAFGRLRKSLCHLSKIVCSIVILRNGDLDNFEGLHAWQIVHVLTHKYASAYILSQKYLVRSCVIQFVRTNMMIQVMIRMQNPISYGSRHH